MKKTTKTLALLLVFSAVAVSCQKENLLSTSPAVVINDNPTIYIYQYDVNGIRSQITLRGETERTNFINRMMALAKEGNTVSFFDETRYSQLLSKDIVTFSTKVKEEALQWIQEKTDLGYQVSVSYDEETGYYNCIATL
ncbi:MAG: hypothetical protein II633_07390 [Bacteroidales bacterium]|nr:hypothetical protein [Bacteroidales bacterium]